MRSRSPEAVLWGLLLLLFLGSPQGTPLTAEEVWTLRVGPEAVSSIPMDPVQMVPAWRARYGDGAQLIWLYATRSPHFFPPSDPSVVAVSGTPWTVVCFFPATWKASERSQWLRQWVGEFLLLFSLPPSGSPIVLPSVLRKG